MKKITKGEAIIAAQMVGLLGLEIILSFSESAFSSEVTKVSENFDLGNIAFLISCIAALSFVDGRYTTAFAMHIANSFRSQYYKKFVSLDYNNIISMNTSDIRFHLEENSAKIPELFLFVIRTINCVIAIVINVVMLYNCSKIMCKLILVVVAIISIITLSTFKLIDIISVKKKVNKKNYFSFMNKAIEKIYKAKMFNCRNILIENFDAFSKDSTKEFISLSSKLKLLRSTLFILNKVVYVAIIYITFKYDNNNMISVVGYIMFYSNIMDNIWTISNYIEVATDGLVAVREFKEIMSIENTVKDGEEEIENVESISFENVGFSYDNENTLKDINITITKGNKIGICGPSGSGKSTISKLLCNFYLPSKGNVKVNGKDINDIKDINSNISIISQDYQLINDTIRNNLIIGKPDATDEEIIEACKNACIWDFIDGLPNKLDTVVGERGIKISGGQRQRIAIATMLLYDPEVIVFDESTSALDNTNELMIKNIIDNLDKTVICIAHRLSTLKDMDCIYYVNEGVVQESGNHYELMERKGLYYSLYNGIA